MKSMLQVPLYSLSCSIYFLQFYMELFKCKLFRHMQFCREKMWSELSIREGNRKHNWKQFYASRIYSLKVRMYTFTNRPKCLSSLIYALKWKWNIFDLRSSCIEAKSKPILKRLGTVMFFNFRHLFFLQSLTGSQSP